MPKLPKTARTKKSTWTRTGSQYYNTPAWKLLKRSMAILRRQTLMRRVDDLYHSNETKHGKSYLDLLSAQWVNTHNQLNGLMKPPCEPCLNNGKIRIAYALDHTVQRIAGGKDDPKNLEWRCESCHNRKSQSESV